MSTTENVKNKIEEQILRSSIAIERHIDKIEADGRAIVSEDILKELRTFIEHTMLRIYADSYSVRYEFGSAYPEIDSAIRAVKTRAKIAFLGKFHEFVQTVASHYTLEPNSAERVMLKYMEYLIQIKNLLDQSFQLNVLNNLEKFPLNTDKSLQEYYEKIAIEIDRVDRNGNTQATQDRYYIHKIKPFFVKQKIYYEVTFTLANEKVNKSDRVIAFTNIDISKYYAVKFWTINKSVQVLDRNLPIIIIQNWEVAIRPIEIEYLGKIFGIGLKGSYNSAEGKALMKYLQVTKMSLSELVTSDEWYYQYFRKKVLAEFNAKVSNIFNVLDDARRIILHQKPGSNILKYLLLHLNYKILRDQYISEPNIKLSNLCLKYGTMPFDQIPYNSSLLGHNPKISDLIELFNPKNHQDELVARFIRNNTEQTGVLYTSPEDLSYYSNLDTLVNEYNDKLYYGHRESREIKTFNRHFYISQDQQATVQTILKLKELSKEGLAGYTQKVQAWLNSSESNVDDIEKRNALEQMFEKSKVAIIYGSAGTGKTTLINHISTLFKDQRRLYLAQTNPAVDNMKRRVVAETLNSDFMTIHKFLKQNVNTDYDIVIVDESSTVSNSDINDILKKASFEMIVLVGDTYQIESIRFGNWFNLAEKFLPANSVITLHNPFRSSNEELQLFWSAVRGEKKKEKEIIQELDARLQYSSNFDETIFTQKIQDEIVLCLNYDGLYGINNINTLLQENNPNPKIQWGLKSYKVGDPVLFNDSLNSKSIYNNLKGWILKIEKVDANCIRFDVEIDGSLTELDLRNSDIKLVEYLGKSNSVIQFDITRPAIPTEDEYVDSVPFQVAYAISIHKAQGLEYDSVKIVITNEVEEKISHSIFYTAITRAKKELKIYWSPEVEHNIINQMKPRSITRDVEFVKQIIASEGFVAN